MLQKLMTVTTTIVHSTGLKPASLLLSATQLLAGCLSHGNTLSPLMEQLLPTE